MQPEKKEELTDEIKDLKKEYIPKSISGEITEEQKKEMEKTRKDLDDLKKKILKKHPFTMSLGIIPPQACDKIEEEEGVPLEVSEKKPVNLMMIIPEEHFKDLSKIKEDIIKDIKASKQNIWLHIKTPVDVWNYSLDGKFDIVSAISMSFPLFDNGFLGSIRVAEIHKSLVLRKFERYVQSYVIAGSLVRGDATSTSDIDVYVVIDDTDVKRMPRLELKEKLRSIIYGYVIEAGELAGVKNKLNVQVYILTEFWESVKDAHPVIFTFIRDGVPLYDKGTFMPWKLLLKMGKLKPSPEAIDLFMASGDKMGQNVRRMLADLLLIDIYWGVITPSQALLMLYGLPPPTPKEILKVFREVFVEKEKILEKKYADILENIIKTYKDFEHEKIKEIPGKDIDKFLKDAEEFMKRLKELRVQIEKRAQQKTIDEIYNNLFSMLKGIFGKNSEANLVRLFENKFVKKGIFPQEYITSLKQISSVKREFKKGKMKMHEIEAARKNASILINHLIEYGQRYEILGLQKGRMFLKTKEKRYELVLTNQGCFLIDEGNVKIIELKTGNLRESNATELENALEQQKESKNIRVNQRIFDILRNKLGEFEILL